MAMLCLQQEEMLAEKVQKAFQFCIIKDLMFLKKKILFKTSGRNWPKVQILQKMVILLEQVASENILKITVPKKLIPCSVSEFITKY